MCPIIIDSIPTLKINSERNTIIDWVNKTIRSKKYEKKNIYKKDQKSDYKNWWKRKKWITDDIFDRVFEDAHKDIQAYMVGFLWEYKKKAEKSEQKFDKRERVW